MLKLQMLHCAHIADSVKTATVLSARCKQPEDLNAHDCC